jgi:thioredoxin reductase
LTAALYLARFNRGFALFDGGDSRAAWIPESHNLPLFTRGIAGWEILQRQREDVHTYGGALIDAEVKTLIRASSDLTVEFQKEGAEPSHLTARFVIFDLGHRSKRYPAAHSKRGRGRSTRADPLLLAPGPMTWVHCRSTTIRKQQFPAFTRQETLPKA